MASVGYARVSTAGQRLDVQLEKLEQFGCDPIFREKESGSRASRAELKECLRYVRKGDVLAITRLDRLARSTLDLHQILGQLQKDEVGFVVLDQSIDTTTSHGRFLFSILAAMAEFELDLRRERQAEGIAKARANGIKLGRPGALSGDQVLELRAKRQSGSPVSELMAKFSVSRSTVYSMLSQAHQCTL
ncbi:MAG: recombinase family protein [Gammaproteobacteria bacterium]|nr:recombinase family protein [Gammaproteobacteria bacterium]